LGQHQHPDAHEREHVTGMIDVDDCRSRDRDRLIARFGHDVAGVRPQDASHDWFKRSSKQHRSHANLREKPPSWTGAAG